MPADLLGDTAPQRTAGGPAPTTSRRGTEEGGQTRATDSRERRTGQSGSRTRTDMMNRRAGEYGLVFADQPPPPARQQGRDEQPARTNSGPRRAQLPPRVVVTDTHRAHGTHACYVLDRCGCQPCRDASTAYERRRRHAINRPDEVWRPYVSAGPARRHLQRLAHAGVGLKQVAKVSGLGHGVLSKLVYGDGARNMGRREGSAKPRPTRSWRSPPPTSRQAPRSTAPPPGLSSRSWWQPATPRPGSRDSSGAASATCDTGPSSGPPQPTPWPTSTVATSTGPPRPARLGGAHDDGPGPPLSRSPWPGEWYRGGRCRTVPTEVFFPTRGEDLEPARAICRNCAVQDDCADYAIPLTGLLGVWGGMSEKERRLARSARRRSQPSHDPDKEPEDGDEAEEDAERQQRPVERAAPPGSLMATLTDLTAYPEAWAIVVHYRSRNSAWSTASLLRTGRRPSPPGGSWEFEGRLSDDGGSDLWARFTPHRAADAAELVGADVGGVTR